MAVRESAYRQGWLTVHDLPLPSVAIGNLTVGGSGKTPIAIWTARYYVSRGLVPGILLRGYGADEVLVHQHAVPEAQVVADPDRAADAARNLAADLQGKIAGPVAIAHLGLHYVEGMVSGRRHAASTLAGKRVVAASGIADPDAFVAQTKATGAAVQVATWKDHHDYRDEDVAWLAHAARRADHVVITQKDAVKLRNRWPTTVPEPLVAMLDLEWEDGGERIAAALDAAVTPVERL
jgi:tetraacyldisaccharide-1-P 4'-kinase